MAANFINSISGRFRAIISLRCLVVTLGFLISLPNLCQSETPLAGTVTTKDGRPTAGVEVFGSTSKVSYPVTREETKTDSEGHFRLEHPGEVIHFFKINFRPQSYVVDPRNPYVRITLEPSAADDLVVPPCGKRVRGQRRIGWGWGNEYAFWFDVPKHEAKLLGGKWDVDYVKYAVKPRNSESHMELWFGPYAIDKYPSHEFVFDSTEDNERNVVASDGGLLGADSWGHLTSGKNWRHTAILGVGGATYRDATSDDAAFFDQIINTVCQAPRPAR